MALEAGAREVHLFVQRREIAKVNAHKPFDNVAYLKHFAEFSELERWRITSHILRTHQPPPQETFDRAAALDGFHMHEDAGWKSVTMSGSSVTTMRYGVPRILEGITRQLFADDVEHLYRQIMNHDEIELIVPPPAADDKGAA